MYKIVKYTTYGVYSYVGSNISCHILKFNSSLKNSVYNKKNFKIKAYRIC